MAFDGTIVDVPSGANLESYFAQMTNGANYKLRLARGGVFDGDVLYRQAGGGPDGEHIIQAGRGSGPLPILTGTFQIGVEATPIDRLRIANLAFTGRGPKVLGSGSHLRLRGLVVGGSQGISIEAESGLRWTTVRVFNCRVLDLSNTSGEHVQGLYCYAVDGLSIYDNVIDHAVAPLDIFSHHIYIQNGCTSVQVYRNILSRSSSHALQLRPGGVARDNLILDCPIGILGGGGTAPESGGVTVLIQNNAVLGGGSIAGDPSLAGAWAYYLENIASGIVSGNIAANGGGSTPYGLVKDCTADAGFGAQVGVLNVTGVNYHKNHGVVHTDAGTSTGTTVVLLAAPIQTASLSMLSLGLNYDDIRAGYVTPTPVIAKIKQLLGC